MLATTVKSWLFNCTMIESWQIERHDAVMERGGRDWWDVVGSDGKKIRVERVEFPYDLGIYANMSQAMGTANFLLWLLPFSGNPKVCKDKSSLGWSWEENGFNRKEGMWPPPDPEKIRRENREWPAARRNYEAELKDMGLMSPEEQKLAFRERQSQDFERRKHLLAELEEVDDHGNLNDDSDINGSDGEHIWENNDGERLGDYGVDEDTDGDAAFTTYDEDVPLAELLRRRRVLRIDDVG
ncbi:DHHC zinc finger domain-containing protein [Pochonia chlamydosporia 170]|uniref:DHHC zinc finger domain-containing protein n=1 Tax=Pochonia chlamydosporia 170 TaxID=1380566 RepID=A0A179G7N6_METCM|nr:DHHC zinc finger domain-containing protein [Pochonia chlamydosporia 170]OAQ73423.1 DHHC zinc finger domain-containing protein [Pochonia chlamydosporia 170]